MAVPEYTQCCGKMGIGNRSQILNLITVCQKRSPIFFKYSSLTFLLGVVGNTLIVVAVGGYRKMKSSTNIFLASLAIADLLFCLICIPVKVSNPNTIEDNPEVISGKNPLCATDA